MRPLLLSVICIAIGFLPALAAAAVSSAELLLTGARAALVHDCSGHADGVFARDDFCVARIFVICARRKTFLFGCPATETAVVDASLQCVEPTECKLEQFHVAQPTFAPITNFSRLAEPSDRPVPDSLDSLLQFLQQVRVGPSAGPETKPKLATAKIETPAASTTVRQHSPRFPQPKTSAAVNVVGFCSSDAPTIAMAVDALNRAHFQPLSELMNRTRRVCTLLDAQATWFGQPADDEPMTDFVTDCALCKKVAADIATQLELLSLFAETITVRLCGRYNEQKAYCKETLQKVIQPLLKASAAILTEDVLCRDVFTVCVDNEKRDHYGIRTKDDDGNKELSCRACRTLIERSTTVAESAASALRYFADLMCTSESRIYDMKWNSICNVRQSITDMVNRVTEAQRNPDKTCYNSRCNDRYANNCMFAQGGGSTTCFEMKCKLGNGESIRCDLGQGFLNGTQCLGENGEMMPCDQMTCSYTESDRYWEKREKVVSRTCARLPAATTPAAIV